MIVLGDGDSSACLEALPGSDDARVRFILVMVLLVDCSDGCGIISPELTSSDCFILDETRR